MKYATLLRTLLLPLLLTATLVSGVFGQGAPRRTGGTTTKDGGTPAPRPTPGIPIPLPTRTPAPVPAPAPERRLPHDCCCDRSAIDRNYDVNGDGTISKDERKRMKEIRKAEHKRAKELRKAQRKADHAAWKVNHKKGRGHDRDDD